MDYIQTNMLKELITHALKETKIKYDMYHNQQKKSGFNNNPFRYRIIQQICMDKLKQYKMLKYIYALIVNEKYMDKNFDENNLRQSNMDCLIVEEVEIMNILQIIYTNINDHKIKDMLIELLLNQQQIINKLNLKQVSGL